MNKIISLTALLLTSCSLFDTSNIQWVYEKGIEPDIKIIPREKWKMEEKIWKIEGKVCYYLYSKGKHYIRVKEGNEWCLNHEFRHIKENIEGLPYHSEDSNKFF